MSNMEEFIVLSKMMPEEMALERLENAIIKYRVLKDEETKHELQMYLMLCSHKFLSEGESIVESLQEMERVKTITKTMDNIKSQ